MRSIQTIQDIISRLQRDDRELKEVQFVGKSSLKGYKTSTGSASDWSILVTTGTPVVHYRLTFTYAKAKKGGIIRLRRFWRINNSAVMDDPVEGYGISPDLTVDVEPYDTTDTTTSWTVVVSNNTVYGGSPTNLTAYVKWFFDGTDTGTWSIVAL